MYNKKSSTICLLATLAAAGVLHDANAACAAATCFLVTGTQEGIANPGQLILDLSYRFIPVDEKRHGTHEVDEVLTPAIDFEAQTIKPDHHREVRTDNELVQLDIGYGFSPHWAAALTLPLVNNRRHEHFNIEDHNGVVEEHFTSGDYSGFGDARLMVKHALHLSVKHLLVGSLGVKAPTGEYKLLNEEGAINEPSIMPGTGSWDGLLGVYYAYQFSPHRWDGFLSGSYQINTQNDLDYRFGDALIVNAGTNYSFIGHERTFTASLQVNARHAPHDEYRSVEVSGTGGTWIYLTPGLSMGASPATRIYTHVQLPVYQRTNESNLVPSYGLIVGMSHTF